jgi:hypothetical protein
MPLVLRATFGIASQFQMLLAVTADATTSSEAKSPSAILRFLDFLDGIKVYVGLACIGVFVIMFIIAAIRAKQLPPLTPAERREAEEKLLDTMSQARIWSAAAGWSKESYDEALHDEMKTMELRRIRRQQR